MTSAKVFAAPKVGARSTSRRGAVVVRAEKISHGKGGEEGGAVLGNDAFGMVAKVASYSMFATAAQKARRPDHHRRISPLASSCRTDVDDSRHARCGKNSASRKSLLISRESSWRGTPGTSPTRPTRPCGDPARSRDPQIEQTFTSSTPATHGRASTSSARSSRVRREPTRFSTAHPDPVQFEDSWVDATDAQLG